MSLPELTASRDELVAAIEHLRAALSERAWMARVLEREFYRPGQTWEGIAQRLAEELIKRVNQG